MSDQNIFSKASFWSNYGSSLDYQERIDVINDLIPLSTINLLDIGCGKGDVITGLLKSGNLINPVGVDPFLDALHFLKSPCVQATLPYIPFSDRSFDLVMCLQVLEHLSAQVYNNSLHEIQRLSRDHIIIGVPNNENLETLQVHCSNCGCKTHAYGHLKCFTKKDMLNLLPDFILQEIILVGVLEHRNSVLGMVLEHRLAHSYYSPDNFICPHCLNNTTSVSNNHKVIRLVTRKINEKLAQLSSELPYWMIAHYRREMGKPN
jgi:SAM-dependent methyltransferase